ncbi:MAG: FitA-like ribbon-helix-helix domain-containing protein [Novosphingobium sp.]
MGQMTVRQLDDALMARLKLRAKASGTSTEALARDAIHRAAEVLTPSEKRALVVEMLAASDAAKVPGAKQTPGWVLIREDRDRDH